MRWMEKRRPDSAEMLSGVTMGHGLARVDGREKKGRGDMEGKGGQRSHHIGPCTISCASEWPDDCQLGSLARASPASLPPPSKPSALSSSPTNSWPPHEAKSKPSGRRPPPSAVQHSLTFLHPNQLAAPFELSLSASCLPTSLDCQFHARRLDQVPSTTRPATGKHRAIFGPIIAVSKCLFCGEAIANCRGREAAQGQFNCRPPLLADFS